MKTLRYCDKARPLLTENSTTHSKSNMWYIYSHQARALFNDAVTRSDFSIDG